MRGAHWTRRVYATTLEYLSTHSPRRKVYEETGLLPHLNRGVTRAADISHLRTVSASMGVTP